MVSGAHRIALNGDVANKVGTYSLAVLAKHHSIPFFVAAPTSSFTPADLTGADIKIEERPVEEMTKICGQVVAALGTKAWNPAFDVTPADLVTGGIVTEFGLFPASKLADAHTFGWR